MPTTTNTTVFRARLNDRMRGAREAAKKVLDGLIFTLYADITENTRVDTGRARAGWQISVFTVGTDAPPPGRYGRPSPQKHIATLAAAPLEAKRFIYNNVHYVIWLELKDHMVKLAVQRLKI